MRDIKRNHGLEPVYLSILHLYSLAELGTNHETGHKQLQQFLEDKKAEGQKEE